MTVSSFLNTVSSALARAVASARLNARALTVHAGARAKPHHNPLHGLHLLQVPRRGRRIGMVLAGLAGLMAVGCAGLWWRLASGPISMDLATPWMISALEERFGRGHRIEVGGTLLERDDDGRIALRVRDITVRDAAGAMVASAPKAEVGFSSMSLLAGQLRAARVSLIGAQMAVRIEQNGYLSVFAGAVEPVAVAATEPVLQSRAAIRGSQFETAAAPPAPSEADAPATNIFATVLEWLQSLDGVGLDGADLAEVGLRNGSITVDDRRTGRNLSFKNINLSLARHTRGVALGVTSTGADGPWSLNATVTAREGGGRSVEAVVRDLSPKDILLAFRLDGEGFATDVPLSGLVRAEIGPDGTPLSINGRIIAGAGFVGDAVDTKARILVDEAQIHLAWDAEKRMLDVPIEVHAGASRVALTARVGPPTQPGGIWTFAVANGAMTLASAADRNEPPLMLDRVSLRATFDGARRRIDLEQVDLRGPQGGVAASGMLDYSDAGSRLKLGVAGTRMPVSAFKRLWPAMIAPSLRAWAETHILGGTVERVDIAADLPLSALRPDSGTMPPDGLTIEVQGRGVSIRPVDGLPVAKDVEIVTKVTGRAATVSFGAASIDLPSGRKITIAPGVFEVADYTVEPSIGRTKIKLEGSLDAAAELMAMEPVRNAASLPFDAGTSRGNVVATMALSLPMMKDLPKRSVVYAVDAEVTGFAAEKFVRGLKGEASLLRVSGTQDTLFIKGDVKIAGTPASIEYRKGREDAEAELRLTATLDEAARARLGFDFEGKLTGTMPVKMSGRMKFNERGSRLLVEADLTQTKVVDLLPGWNKAPGRPARASFVLVDRPQSMRLEEFSLEGSGASVKGTVELNEAGDVVQANLPRFAVSDGDKASLKVERGSDGTMTVTLRGDVYDGRGLVKTAVAGQKPELRPKRPAQDLDLDIRIGAITGHHGEALRAFELRMSRRGGVIRSFTVKGGLGAQGRIVGEMRNRGGTGGKPVIYAESTDAGALFRFTDTYPRIFGGAMSVAMEPPTTDNAPQEGLLNIHDFSVRGEPALDRVAAANTDQPGAAPGTAGGVSFSRMRLEFTRSPGRFSIRDGVVWGPSIGATVDGTLDYFRDEVRLRGTFVPAYGINNMFSRLPIVGMFLGGGANEGLLGVTYQVVGSPRAPVLNVNPMSAVAPGFLRKLFEFRGAEDRTGRVNEYQSTR